MKIIEKLSDQLEEELKGADKYIECAMKYKDNDVLLAKMYADMSTDELKHVMNIHDSVVRLINEYKNGGEVVPPEMQAIYDYLHERHIEKFNEIKLKQTVYRGQ